MMAQPISHQSICSDGERDEINITRKCVKTQMQNKQQQTNNKRHFKLKLYLFVTK